jgi:hypothetical protein
MPLLSLLPTVICLDKRRYRSAISVDLVSPSAKAAMVTSSSTICAAMLFSSPCMKSTLETELFKYCVNLDLRNSKLLFPRCVD